MTYETQIDGHSGTLSVSTNEVVYQRTDEQEVRGDFSTATIGPAEFSILLNGRSFHAVVVATENTTEVFVNGRAFRVDIFDPRSLRGRKSEDAAGGRQIVVAPMPGRVIRVLVEAGQTVEAGQGLVVVEAMKMQNEMKASRAGIVTQLKAQAGATVATGETLLVLE